MRRRPYPVSVPSIGMVEVAQPASRVSQSRAAEQIQESAVRGFVRDIRCA